MLSYLPGTSACPGESPHSPPWALLPGEMISVGPPQSLLSCHLLLAARAQISSQDLIHLI